MRAVKTAAGMTRRGSMGGSLPAGPCRILGRTLAISGCSIGVPIGISRARRRMSALRMRMQPWLTRPGIRSGRSVPWMPTKPAAGPVRQRRRACAGAERDRPVERAAEAREAVADVELARGRGRRGGADADRRAEDAAPVAQQRRGQARGGRPRAAWSRSRSRRARSAGPSRSCRSGSTGRPTLTQMRPSAAVARPSAATMLVVPSGVRRPSRATTGRAARRARARRDRAPHAAPSATRGGRARAAPARRR